MADTDQAKFIVQVKPNAKQNQVIGFKEGVLHIRIAAPPVDGKANYALIMFLSDELGVSKSSLAIERGLSGKTKTILVRGLNPGELISRLELMTR